MYVAPHRTYIFEKYEYTNVEYCLTLLFKTDFERVVWSRFETDGYSPPLFRSFFRFTLSSRHFHKPTFCTRPDRARDQNELFMISLIHRPFALL